MTVPAGKCPAGCGRHQRTGQFLCSVCWKEVPPHLQREIYRTWRAWRKDFSDAEKLHAYQHARDEALAAIA